VSQQLWGLLFVPHFSFYVCKQSTEKKHSATNSPPWDTFNKVNPVNRSFTQCPLMYIFDPCSFSFYWQVQSSRSPSSMAHYSVSVLLVGLGQRHSHRLVSAHRNRNHYHRPREQHTGKVSQPTCLANALLAGLLQSATPTEPETEQCI